MKIQNLREDARVNRLVRKILSVLSPEFLKPKFRRMCPAGAHNTWGHCYAATEALFHALGGYDSEWRPARAKDDDGITHWWLENIRTGERLDITAEQYTSVGKEPPYGRGRRAGFLTRQPSDRAARILRAAGLSPNQEADPAVRA